MPYLAFSAINHSAIPLSYAVGSSTGAIVNFNSMWLASGSNTIFLNTTKGMVRHLFSEIRKNLFEL